MLSRRIASTFRVELALNIVWLVVAVSLFLLCGAHALSFTEKERRVTAFVALVCLIWFLFPIISITDDLNASQSIVATTAVKKATQFNEVAKTFPVLLPAPPLAQDAAWRDINLHADQCDIQQEFFAFDLSRRPPPQRG